MVSTTAPGSSKWHALIQEDIVDPARRIIHPHHHLWPNTFNQDYLLDELWGDTDSGHNIVKTVFIECRAFYLKNGPEHLSSLGETATITEIAARSHAQQDRAQIGGIVAHADLRLGGKPEVLNEVLVAHREKSKGLLRGIRHSAARDSHPEHLLITGRAPLNLYGREDVRAGIRLLSEHDLIYHAWHFHHQNEAFYQLALAAPETTMILDHFGTPLGVGIYRNRQQEIFRQWQKDIHRIASCPNVYLKLGGLAMPDNGFGWDTRETPPGSDEFVQAQKKYYLYALEKFGVERCMFESNFPVDRLSISYAVLWNGLKKWWRISAKMRKTNCFIATLKKSIDSEFSRHHLRRPASRRLLPRRQL